MKADEQADNKTRERTEGAATAVQAMHGDSCSTTRVDPDPMCSTSVGDDCTGSPAPSCSGENALVDNGAAAPKSCLSPLKMRTTSAAGGLLPTGETTTTTKPTINKPSLRLYSTEETNSKETNSKETNLWIAVPSAWYDSSFRKLLAAPSCRRAIKTKSGQNRMFDPGGFQGRLRACPFLERSVRCLVERLYVLERLVAICSVFSGWKEVRGIPFCRARYKQLNRYFSVAVDFLKVMP